MSVRVGAPRALSRSPYCLTPEQRDNTIGGRSLWAQIVTDIGLTVSGRPSCQVFGLAGMRTTTATIAGPIACRIRCGPLQSNGEEKVPSVRR